MPIENINTPEKLQQLIDEERETALWGLMGYWIATLCLDRWQITMELRRAHEMEEKACTGYNTYTFEGLISEIFLLHPTDWNPKEFHSYDPEQTLVHELLHLIICPWQKPQRGSLQDSLEEQSIQTLARVLVGMRRELAEAHGHAG